MTLTEKTRIELPLGVSVAERVGKTPLLRVARVGREFPQVEFYLKAEWFNPGGSVKDRPALNMILEGERSGKLTAGKIILDATSGNTGIAYALLGAARGYRVRLCLPANASLERKRITTARRWRSGSRPPGASRTSSPGSAPAGPSSAPPAA